MFSILLALIYISFISLGLPDAVLGAAWPVMHQELCVPVSAMGAISLTISSATVVSSLLTDTLTRRFGTGRITAVSVAVTALGILGFSFSRELWQILLLAVPYGLGAGCVDASLNHYVAVHYASRHMSWLHCMWGIGAFTGPYIMGFALTKGFTWNSGYLAVGIAQAVLACVLFLTLPVWKIHKRDASSSQKRKPVSLKAVFRIPGALHVLIGFFCYCALEQTAGQWASSYFVLHNGLEESFAASLASVFYIGITLGRLLGGFLSLRISNRGMIRIGEGILFAGIAVLIFPVGLWGSIAGFALIGLGCAPIYPCVTHSTPDNFGEENSQAIIGVQMAFAYLGILIMPPLYGLLSQYIGVQILPVYLLILGGIMLWNLEKQNYICCPRSIKIEK